MGCKNDGMGIGTREGSNGGRMVIGVPWFGHCGGRCFFPLWSMANLRRHFHSTHTLLSHFRRLRLLLVSLSFSLKSPFSLPSISIASSPTLSITGVSLAQFSAISARMQFFLSNTTAAIVPILFYRYCCSFLFRFIPSTCATDAEKFFVLFRCMDLSVFCVVFYELWPTTSMTVESISNSSSFSLDKLLRLIHYGNRFFILFRSRFALFWHLNTSFSLYLCLLCAIFTNEMQMPPVRISFFTKGSWRCPYSWQYCKFGFLCGFKISLGPYWWRHWKLSGTDIVWVLELLIFSYRNENIKWEQL